LSQRAASPIRVERVEPGEEVVLPDREQRELDALPSRLSGAGALSEFADPDNGGVAARRAV
jgi:hypothetical protein